MINSHKPSAWLTVPVLIFLKPGHFSNLIKVIYAYAFYF